LPDSIPADPIPNPELRREKTKEEIDNRIKNEPALSERIRTTFSMVWDEKNSSVRAYLREQYQGKCQVCNYTFIKLNGETYFEGVYLVSHIHKKWIDRPGNVICLCANCAAKFMYGRVICEDIQGQITSYRTLKEGGTQNPTILMDLCGDTVEIRYTERHMLDLQEISKLLPSQKRRQAF
jgi:hypothetical protein